MRRATESSAAWGYFSELNPDLALLQEVTGFPSSVRDEYSTHGSRALTKSGGEQVFGTFILSRAQVRPMQLEAGIEWVDKRSEKYQGNLVAGRTEFLGSRLNVVSVHSPAWPLTIDDLTAEQVDTIKLTQNPDLWLTEILWAAVREREEAGNWVVGGDLNSSETFDYLWSGGPRGNREILDRMNAAGFTEALRNRRGELTPTFRNHRGGKVVHQIDHLFFTSGVLNRVRDCRVGSAEAVFGQGLSDHLPIVADLS